MAKITLKIVTVTNNPIEYPEYADVSEEFSWLIKHIQDECETFVIDPRHNDSFCYADEFFARNPVVDIGVEESEVF